MDINKPVAWVELEAWLSGECYPDDCFGDKEFTGSIPLYIHPAKPAICVGYWDNKTGAFHKHLTEVQQKRVDEGFLQPVYTAGMLPVKELTDEEIWECHDKTNTNNWVIDFARAILRKAQEK